MREKESWNINLMRLSKQSLELESVLKEAGRKFRNFIFNFLINKAGLNLKTICACTEKY
jgi:hypothetical protein